MMRVQILQSVIVSLVVGMCCSNGYALNVIGPANAELGKGRFEFGADYSYGRFGLDFEFKEGTALMPDFSRDRMKMDITSGRIGYGLTDRIEGFFRLGEARIRNTEFGQRFSGSGEAYGFGAKVTFQEFYLVKWGAQAQVNWIETDGDWSGRTGFVNWTGETDVELMQILVAMGANYQLTDGLFMYGGPFVYFLDGKKEYNEISPVPGWFEKYDIDNQTYFGGYVGLKMDPIRDVILSLEYQMTSHDDIFAMSLVWRH